MQSSEASFPRPDLLPHHLAQLSRSAISDDVVRARGFFSVTEKKDLIELGFKPAQARVPTLLIPLHGARGGIVGYQHRPDSPRMRAGEPAKYESLPGTPSVLDVHPLCREKLADPAVRLWITEGVKKGDALVTAGEVAIALNGVYGWRGRNKYDGLVAHPDWESVPLNGRDVVLVFDSDLATNRNVALALLRLRRFLESWHARVRIVYLPASGDGSKVGVDDFLAAGGSLETLLTESGESTGETRIAQPTATAVGGPGHPYKFTDYGIEMTKFVKDIPIDIRLTNFPAEIIEDADVDDGVESTRHLTIRATVGGRDLTVSVPASEFSPFNWVMSKLGSGAIVGPGPGIHENARAAIQYLSTHTQRITAFAHLGWRKVDGEWVYLHAGGAITRDGLRTDLTVQLPKDLRRYELPDPASVNLEVSFKAVLRLLGILGPVRGWRLLSLVFLAILAEILPPDFVAWLWGRTGTFKSSAAALVSNFFGVFDRLTLPGNLKSTANATEALAFAAKDVIFVVDDFAPSSSQGAHATQELTVFKLIRAVGDRHARNRMRADRSIVGEKPPRGLVLLTAEMTPPAGQSTQARCFEIEWDNVGIDTEALAGAQENDGPLYAGFTALFVQDVARRFASLSDELPRRVLALRSEFIASHRRVAETATKLIVATETFLEFAARAGLISDPEKLAHLSEAVAAISSAASKSSEAQADRSPVALLFEGLRTAFGLRQAHLDDVNGRSQSNLEGWGYINGAPDPISKLIGWFDSKAEIVYVSASAALRSAAHALGDGAELPQSVRSVGELLKGDRKLARVEGTRSTVVAQIGSTRQRVWALRAKDFLLEETVPTVSTVPEQAKPASADAQADHRENDAEVDHGDDDDDPEGGGGGGGGGGEGGGTPAPSPVQARASRQGGDGGRSGVITVRPTPLPPRPRPITDQAELPPVEVKFTSITTSEGLASLIRTVNQYRGHIGIDVETSGLNPREDRLRLVQVALGADVFVVDAFAVDIQPLAGALAEHELVGHNLLFDLSFLHPAGLRPGLVFDTFLASQLLNSGVPRKDGYHSLQALAARELRLNLPKELQRSDWTGALSHGQLAYAARDARAVFLLRDSLVARLEANGLTRVAAIENRCLPAVVSMALRGVPIDEAAWRAENGRDADALTAADRELADLLNSHRPGVTVNWRSPKQVVQLFSDLGTTLSSTSAETLSRVDHPIARAITRRSHLAHRTATWGEKFFRYVKDGRVYPEWRQLGAASGRMSCGKPPFQAIPRDGYKAHIRPAPGSVLVDGDYSQIEMRLGAKIANETRLIELFLQGADLHEATARLLLKKDEITKEERNRAKACNFGFLFGMGSSRFRDYARNDYGVELTEAEARSFRERFFAAYPNLRRWHSEVGRSTARETRTLSGRRRFLAATDFTARVNTPVQGTCADGLKQALALLWERRNEHPEAVPVLAVHDQIVIETTPEAAEGVREWLVKAMKDGMQEFTDPVPVKVDTKIITSDRKEEE